MVYWDGPDLFDGGTGTDTVSYEWASTYGITVINLTDSLFFLLSVPNIIGLYLMSGEVRRDTEAYFSLVKDGKA